VPAGTAKEIIVRLHAEITRILALPDVRGKLTGLGFELVGGTPEEFGALIRSDIARVGKVLKQAGIRAE
jgi:tripartite-type tricarboxylate transporter receptor subunit TctC